MVYKQIAGLIPTIQAVTLAAENVRVAKKKDKDLKDIVGLGATNIVGTSLLKINADLISGL